MIGRALGGLRSRLVRSDLVGEVTQGREVVLDFLVRRQSGLAIVRDRFFIGGAGLLIHSGAGPEIEQGHGGGPAHRPDTAGCLQPLRADEALETRFTRERENREPRGTRYTDLR